MADHLFRSRGICWGHNHFGFLGALVLGACSVTQEPSVPGMENNAITRKPVPLSTVMTALKCQLARAFVEIEERKATEQHSLAESFRLKKGSGVFSGKTQVVQTDEGKISAVVPFSNVMGRVFGPNFAATLASTNVQETVRTFAIDPRASSDDICRAPELQDVEVGNFVTDALVTAFAETLKMPTIVGGQGSGAPYQPLLKNTEIQINTSFTVQQKWAGGLSSTIVLDNADQDTLQPSLAANRDGTGIYSLNLKFPMLTGDITDPRRLIFCLFGETGSATGTLCVEEPYTQDRYIALRDQVKSFESDPGAMEFRDDEAPDAAELGDQVPFRPEIDPHPF